MDTSASCYRHQRKNKKKEELDCDGTYTWSFLNSISNQ